MGSVSEVPNRDAGQVGVFEPSYRGPRGIWELLKDWMSVMVIIQLYKAGKTAWHRGKLLTSHVELQNICPQIKDIVSICIHMVTNVGHFVIAAFHLAGICADQHWIICHLILLYQRLLLDKCTCVTSIFKSVIPLGYSASGVTQKALKRLNRSEQEPACVLFSARAVLILCGCL